MALQHLRSSTADKRPTPAAMSDGQLAMNTNLVSPGLFFKDSNGDSVKIGPVHVGTTAPNVTPGAGGQAGNSKGEQWLDTSSSRYVFKIWDGTAWRTEDGEFVNTSGDTMTGALVMDNQQQVRFRETTANGTNFVALQAPAAVASDRTLTLPDVTGTIVSTGDTGSVTSTMILDGTILNADVNASAAIAGTKISPDFGSQTIASTGVFSHALGAAATPSLTFTGDLNTGIWSPAADTVAASTAGSERLRITSAGLVGIGTSAPQTALGFPIGTTTRISQGAGTTHSASNVGSLGITIDDGGGLTGITVNNTHNGTYSSQDIRFSTAEGGVITGTERMRITPAGNVGIGTATPGQKLDVVGAIRTSTGSDFFDIAQDGANGSLTNSEGSMLFYAPASTAYIYHFNSVEKMRLGATGDLKITQTPGAYTIDTAGGATSIANGGTVDFSNASGMLVANSHAAGSVTIYLCGGGSTSAVSTVGAQVGTLTYVSGINGYRWANNSGSTATLGFFFLRTRPDA